MSHDRGCFRCFEDRSHRHSCREADCPYKDKPNPWKKPMKEPIDDFGFTFSDSEEIKAKVEDKAQRIYDAIVPFLNNLAKNPEKDTIIWPNRKDKIENFRKKLKQIVDE